LLVFQREHLQKITVAVRVNYVWMAGWMIRLFESNVL